MNLLQKSLTTACIIFLCPVWASAAYVHGDFIGNAVDFTMVTETNDHEPDQFWDVSSILGDTLLVNPVDFRVDASPGPATDFLDSQLEMMIQSKSGPLAGLTFAEYGDYFITGNSTISASLNWFLDIPGTGTAGGTLQVTDATTGPSNKTMTWALEIDIDLIAGTANGAPLTDVVTGLPLALPADIQKVTFEFDNTLFAGADDVMSTAFIAKKGTTGIGIRTVPEPSGIALSLLGMILLMIQFVRRQS